MIESALEEVGYIKSPTGEKLRLLRGIDMDVAAELHYHSMSSPEENDRRLFSTPEQTFRKITDLGDKALLLSLVSETQGMVGAAWLTHDSRKSRRFELTPGVCVYDGASRRHGFGSFLVEHLHDITDREHPIRLGFVIPSVNQAAYEFALSHGYRFEDNEARRIGKIKMSRPRKPKI